MSKLTISQYVSNKLERNKAVYSTKNGFNYNGKNYTENEFEQLLPIDKPLFKNGEREKDYKGINPDSRRQY